MMWLDRRMRLKEKDTWIDTETENPKDEEKEQVEIDWQTMKQLKSRLILLLQKFQKWEKDILRKKDARRLQRIQGHVIGSNRENMLMGQMRELR